MDNYIDKKGKSRIIQLSNKIYSLIGHSPALINSIHYQCAEDEEDEEGNEHVVDRPKMIDFKKLTTEK